jgi:ABC-2 type transport system permease protein
MIKRIFSIIIKEFIHLRRDWWMPAFMLIGGALELILVGWATGRPITNLPLIVLDQDKTAASQMVITQLENTGTFNFQFWANDMDEIRTKMDRGEVNAAVIIPDGFQTDMHSAHNQPTLLVLLNGADSTAAQEALRAIEGTTRTIGESLALKRLGLSAKELKKFDFSVRVRYNEELKESYYTTPAELALMLEFTILLFAALTFARERELGTLEQLLVMPFSSFEIILGKAIPVMLIGFVDFSFLLGMTTLFFGIPIRGSVVLLLVLAIVYILAELGKGLVVSVFSRSQHQAFLIVMLIGMTDFMFTGYAVPVEAMPKILQWIANFVPAHHWLAIVRGILLKGSDLTILWPHVLALAGLGLVIGGVSTLVMRKALN